MVKTIKAAKCTHCKKEIKGKIKLIGISFICPHCGKPCEDFS